VKPAYRQAGPNNLLIRDLKNTIMERIEALISKLKEQFEQQADTAQMLLTAQMLQQELYILREGAPQTLGTPKVAVIMPNGGN